MDLGRRVPLQEHDDFKMPSSSWSPGTPTKAVPLDRSLTSGDSQGNQASSSCWFESTGVAVGDHSSQFLVINAGPGHPGDHTPDLNICQEAVLASEGRVFSHITSQAHAVGNFMHGWPQIPFSDLLAFSNVSVQNNAATSPQSMFAHIGGDREQSSSQNQLLLNGRVLLSRNHIDSNNCQPTSNHGFPVPHHPSYSRNSPPENAAKFTTSETGTPPVAPMTPDKCKGIQDGRPLGSVHPMDERESGRKGQEQDVIPHPFAQGKEPVQLCFNHGLSKPSNDPSNVLLSQQEENQKLQKEEKQGIDLNKTPQQKPLRKRHRPKVIQEDKPARTPKPVTPEPAGTRENKSGKRKYVRKKGQADPTGAIGGIVELDERKGATKPVKRTLNFDEVDQATDGCQDVPVAFISSIKSTIELTRRLSSKEQATQLIPQGQNISYSILNLPMTGESSKKVRKRDYTLTPNNAEIDNLDIARVNIDLAQTYNEIAGIIGYQNAGKKNVPYFPKIPKKRRTGRGHGELTNNVAASLMHSHFKHEEQNQFLHNASKVLSFPDAHRFLETENFQVMNGKQALSPMGYVKKKRSEAKIRPRNLSYLTANLECDQLPATPKHLQPYDKRQSGIMYSSQSCLEALVAANHTRTTKRRTMKGQTQGISSMNLNANKEVAECILIQKYDASTASTPRNFQRNSLHPLQVNPTHEYNTSSNFEELLHANLLSRAVVPHVNPVDAIVQRMRSLDINSGHEKEAVRAQTALVPYNGYRMMVPLDGQFIHTKKQRPRAKVDLDSETARVWKLLMGKESIGDVDGTDVYKEKWWEEERQVFHGRADSFIARMHLIQGDRRFSKWKGSVVDSVVGVFLTQNVSDHLSSSAFMALAARFPPRSTSKNTEPNAGKGKTSMEQKEVSTLDINDSEKTSGHQGSGQVSTVLHKVEIMKGWKIGNNNSYLGSSVVGGMVANLEGKYLADCGQTQEISHASPEDRTDTPVTVTASTSLAEAEDRRPTDDALSSQNSIVSFQNSADYPVQTADKIGLNSESTSEADDLKTGNKCTRSFMRILQMAGTSTFHEFYNFENGGGPMGENYNSPTANVASTEIKTRKSSLDELVKPNDVSSSTSMSISHPHHTNHDFTGDSHVSTSYMALQCKKHLYCQDSLSKMMTEALLNNSSFHDCPDLCHDVVKIQLKQREANNQVENARSPTEALDQMQNSKMHQAHSGPIYLMETGKVVECTSMIEKRKVANKAVELNPKDEACGSSKVPVETVRKALKANSRKVETEKNKPFDWDSLRKQACCNGAKKESSTDRMDSLDWEAVRCADISEISNTIRQRGMNNVLAGRIKDFLNRLVREHGSIDLEWLRDVPPDKAKDYLLSIRGLGLKSVECVRLLTLHHLAFPVDTNVGRICVRLGWVPLQPLPESLQLHLLELYPMLETIQKYLWPRLCKLDQRTL